MRTCTVVVNRVVINLRMLLVAFTGKNEVLKYLL